MLASRITTLRLLSSDSSLTRKDAQGAIVELCDALTACQRRREKPKFTLREVMIEAEQMNWPAGMAEECFDCYDAVGWVRGKNQVPLVRLPALMRTWMRNQKKWNSNNGKPKTSDFAL